MPQRAMLLLPLLASLAGLAVGEVGEKRNFDNCNQFFYKNTPPTLGITEGPYTSVCQKYKNNYHFATLYDGHRRTPLYSAYLFTKNSSPNVARCPAEGTGEQVGKIWMYEPQLAKSDNSQMAVPEDTLTNDLLASQAFSKDYINSGYTRGHLNPRGHNQDNDDQEATYTMTNIVPQKHDSNCATWNVLETEVRTRLDTYCKQPYVITGVLPYIEGGKPPPPPLLNKRVAVPEYMWTAYCCPSYKTDLPKEEEKFFPTYAAVGRNDDGSDETIVPKDTKNKNLGYTVKRMSLVELEGILSKRLGKSDLSLFKGNCL